ncbi:NACHT, LRR and PYD domains-containing protein 3-like [Latimeria chalumnae]|uniref:NACHT, LRR and PYD domains-containing protein 3-like n=1 Tax=Latimeria chalumnae TaxID=7897 RepID=UPI0006D8E583|nr:PREDICTED: NACHT, LRR and PYD domains-containing protein 3-like [Latimeria chalumnae]|eukprot:XP_006000762.2 PREDICTED: NACHT, LRR and PYD domains-containing protein 3-like [Latimeria chalumnae]
MASSIKESILRVLDDLREEELKRFKTKLQDTPTKAGLGKIPRGKLEKADTIDVSELMTNHFPAAYAVEITVKILRDINKINLITEFQQYTEAETGGFQEYRDEVKKNNEKFKHYSATQGEWLYVNDWYLRLLLTKKKLQRKEKEDFLRTLGEQYKDKMDQLAADTDFCTNTEKLFTADTKGKIPKTVVLQGVPGIGKTFTTKKIMVDWVSSKFLKWPFLYVFYLDCQEINQLTGSLSVADLLLHKYPSLKPVKEKVFSSPETILIILDGFDELKFSFKGKDEGGTESEKNEFPVEIAVSKLLRRKVLLKASLLITTRPEALDRLPEQLVIDRYVEILGLSERGVERYFIKFFKNDQQAFQAFNVMRENEVLFTMCYIPTICWTVCRVLKQLIENGVDLAKDCKSTTQVLVSYMNTVQRFHTQSQENDDAALFKKLGTLALYGVKNQKVLFDQKDLEQFSFSLSEVPSSFLHKMIFEVDENVGIVYSFLHVRIQEFFAALYCVQYEVNEVNALLQEVLHEGKSHLSSTATFIFGFTNTEMADKLSYKISSQFRSSLLDWVKEALKKQRGSDFLQLLHSLYEMHEEEFTKSAMEDLKDINLSDVCSQRLNCIAINHCVLHSCDLDKINLSGCNLGSPELKVLLPVLQQSSISEIDLSNNVLEDEAVKILCTALKDEHCRVETLRLGKCALTAGCCGDLSVLSQNSSLTELDLKENKLGDQGVKLLSAGLKEPNCKLHKLGLAECNLTSSSCGKLSAVFVTNSLLTELNLSQNKLGDSGVKMLCDGLNKSNCRLEKLEFIECGLTAGCCTDLSSAISKNSSLTELNLNKNRLGDSGVKLLLAALKEAACGLEKLGLGECDLRAGCCGEFSSIFSNGSSLKDLDLSGNNLGDSEVKLLLAALNDPNCKLQKLRLGKCDLTAGLCNELSSILIKNSSLKELDLSKNKLKDSGVKLLWAALKDSNCKIQKLELRDCDLTDDCYKDLASALRTNSSLIELDISSNRKLKESGVKMLHQELKNSNYKLRKLE